MSDGFCIHRKILLHRVFILKSLERPYVSLKTVLWILEIALRLRNQKTLLKLFYILTNTFFKILDYRLSVESTTIESAPFPFKRSRRTEFCH